MDNPRCQQGRFSLTWHPPDMQGAGTSRRRAGKVSALSSTRQAWLPESRGSSCGVRMRTRPLDCVVMPTFPHVLHCRQLRVARQEVRLSSAADCEAAAAQEAQQHQLRSELVAARDQERQLRAENVELAQQLQEERADKAALLDFIQVGFAQLLPTSPQLWALVSNGPPQLPRKTSNTGGRQQDLSTVLVQRVSDDAAPFWTSSWLAVAGGGRRGVASRAAAHVSGKLVTSLVRRLA